MILGTGAIVQNHQWIRKDIGTEMIAFQCRTCGHRAWMYEDPAEVPLDFDPCKSEDSYEAPECPGYYDK